MLKRADGNSLISVASFCVALPKQTIELMATNTMHREGPVAEAIEEQTAKLPSDLFLWCALGAMAASATLKASGKNDAALFVGQWAAPFLLLGVYNKLVKLEGHDGQDGEAAHGK